MGRGFLVSEIDPPEVFQFFEIPRVEDGDGVGSVDSTLPPYTPRGYVDLLIGATPGLLRRAGQGFLFPGGHTPIVVPQTGLQEEGSGPALVVGAVLGGPRGGRRGEHGCLAVEVVMVAAPDHPCMSWGVDYPGCRGGLLEAVRGCWRPSGVAGGSEGFGYHVSGAALRPWLRARRLRFRGPRSDAPSHRASATTSAVRRFLGSTSESTEPEVRRSCRTPCRA